MDPNSSVFYTTSATTGNEQHKTSYCGAKKQEQFSPELQDPLGALWSPAQTWGATAAPPGVALRALASVKHRSTEHKPLRLAELV